LDFYQETTTFHVKLNYYFACKANYPFTSKGLAINPSENLRKNKFLVVDCTDLKLYENTAIDVVRFILSKTTFFI